MYSMISGVITEAFSHSGCKYNLQCGETWPVNFSAHSKSDLLNITTLSSCASGRICDKGDLNFFGERQIQSHTPLNGCAPEVSICIFNPASWKTEVSSSRSCIKGSPPVITTICAGVFFTMASRSCIRCNGCLPPSQLSFTSHQTQPTS